MPQLDPVLIFFQSTSLIFFYLIFYFFFFRRLIFPFFFINYKFNYYMLNKLYFRSIRNFYILCVYLFKLKLWNVISLKIMTNIILKTYLNYFNYTLNLQKLYIIFINFSNIFFFFNKIKFIK